MPLAEKAFYTRVAALLLLLVLQPTRFRPLAALTVIAAAAVWGSSQSPGSMPAPEIAWRLPGFESPGTGAFWESLRDVLLPQLALTLTNATVITAAIAADYFPDDRARITPDRLAMSTGVMNLLLAPFGAFPMCHGTGGLVVQHRFGARIGLAPAIFGMACLVSGLRLGEQALALLALLPMAAIGAVLLLAGLNPAVSKTLRRASPDRLFVIGLIEISCVLMNVAMGLLVGIVLEWLRVRVSACPRGRRRRAGVIPLSWGDSGRFGRPGVRRPDCATQGGGNVHSYATLATGGGCWAARNGRLDDSCQVGHTWYVVDSISGVLHHAFGRYQQGRQGVFR
jgi:MFS superfamily sulfate permease-like transporter